MSKLPFAHPKSNSLSPAAVGVWAIAMQNAAAPSGPSGLPLRRCVCVCVCVCARARGQNAVQFLGHLDSQALRAACAFACARVSRCGAVRACSPTRLRRRLFAQRGEGAFPQWKRSARPRRRSGRRSPTLPCPRRESECEPTGTDGHAAPPSLFQPKGVVRAARVTPGAAL